jgi:adenylate kinase family enzyme
MEKIVIIGSPGAGKSTLACQLGQLLNIEVFHLDRFFWQSGWREKPRDARIGILKDLVQEEHWIIEGTYLSSSEPRLIAADTVIFLDISPLLCLQRIGRRHNKYKGQSRLDLPDGCSDNFNLICILKVLAFPVRGRRALKQKLRKYNSKQIIWLHSGKEVEDFLAQQKRLAGDMMTSPTTALVAKVADAPEPHDSGVSAALLPLSSRIRSAIAGLRFR